MKSLIVGSNASHVLSHNIGIRELAELFLEIKDCIFASTLHLNDTSKPILSLENANINFIPTILNSPTE